MSGAGLLRPSCSRKLPSSMRNNGLTWSSNAFVRALDVSRSQVRVRVQDARASQILLPELSAARKSFFDISPAPGGVSQPGTCLNISCEHWHESVAMQRA